MQDNTDKKQTIWVEENDGSNFMRLLWNSLKWLALFLITATVLLSFFGWITTSSYSGPLNNIDENAKSLTL